MSWDDIEWGMAIAPTAVGKLVRKKKKEEIAIEEEQLRVAEEIAKLRERLAYLEGLIKDDK